MKFEVPSITIYFFGMEDIVTVSRTISTTNYWDQTDYPWLPECPAELPMD